MLIQHRPALPFLKSQSQDRLEFRVLACRRHTECAYYQRRQKLKTQNELRGSTTKLSKIKLVRRVDATANPADSRHECLRPVGSRILPAYNDLSTGRSKTRVKWQEYLPLLVFGSPKPSRRLAEGQIPLVASTCRKSGSFARDKGYLNSVRLPGKGSNAFF